mmetsp:Transcript_988/g.1288  ORF Transcript_988/g.1288 Transcript_988/m.1288 type:complete len:486 (-) Transcript_988:398-1855(-)
MRTTPIFSSCLSALLTASLIRSGLSDAVSTKFNVMIPKELSKHDGYDHRDAMFGVLPYGGTIQQQVYYADSTMCDPSAINSNSKGGYPTRSDNSPWKPPFILLIDRGDCSFVQKVRHSQRAGASAVLIADSLCICGHEGCEDDNYSMEAGAPPPTKEGQICESQEPIMADDGSGSDISIPSFLLFKEDAEPLKKALMKETHVRAQLSFSVPAPDSRVEYDLWTSPADATTRELTEDFFAAVQALSEHAFFTPHMYIYDGVYAGCHSAEGQDFCKDLCSNAGRYCSIEVDFKSGASGAEVVAEALRRICVWNLYGKKDGVGMAWWKYVREFTERCDSSTLDDKGSIFSDEDCISAAMKAAGVKKADIDQCMQASGGTEGDNANELLEKEIADQLKSGVVLVPSLLVNQAVIRGYLNFGTTFRAICAGFAPGSEPTICNECATCADEKTCVSKGKCATGSFFIGGPNGGVVGGVGVSYFRGTMAVLY